MNKMKRNLVLMGLILSLGATMVACNDEEKAPETPAVEQAEGEEAEADEHSHDMPEWRGTYELAEGEYTVKINKNEGEDGLGIGFFKTETDLNEENFKDLVIHKMNGSMEMPHVHLGEEFEVENEQAYDIHLEGETGEVKFKVTDADEYYIFLEHMADEFDFEVVDAEGNVLEAKDVEVFEHDHEH